MDRCWFPMTGVTASGGCATRDSSTVGAVCDRPLKPAVIEAVNESELHRPPLQLITWVRDSALPRRNRNRRRGRQIMTRFRVAVPSGKISRLIGDHYFFLGHRTHVDRLIGASTRRENHSPRIV